MKFNNNKFLQSIFCFAFASNAFAFTDADMRQNNNDTSYVPEVSALNSYCGANGFAGGGFSHSSVYVNIPTFYRRGVSGDFIYLKNQKTGEYVSTGVRDSADGYSNLNSALTRLYSLEDSFTYSNVVHINPGLSNYSQGVYGVGAQDYEPGTNFCYANPVAENAVVTQINAQISHDLASQRPDIVVPQEVGYANYPNDGYVEVGNVAYNQTCGVKEEIFSGNNIYLSPGDNKSWQATRLVKIYHAQGPGNIHKLYSFTNAGAVTDSNQEFANNYSPAILGMYKIAAGGVTPFYSADLPTCVAPVKASIHLNCDAGYSTDGKIGGNTTYQSGNLNYYQGMGKIYIRNSSSGQAKEFSSSDFDSLPKEDKESLLDNYGTDVSAKQACLLAQPDTTEPTEPAEPIYVASQLATDNVFCPSGFSNDGTSSGGTSVGKGIIQIYTYNGVEYARHNMTGAFLPYTAADFYNSSSKRDDVDRFGSWEETPKACLFIQNTQPANPTNPTEPTIPDPAFSFNNPVFINCKYGDTVGGVVGGQSYRSGSVDFYGRWESAKNAFVYYTKKGNEFSEVVMTDNGNGTSSFPNYTANDVDFFGKWNVGSEQACATPVVVPVDPTPPVTPPEQPTQPVVTPSYSFDLPYNEYCTYGDTVGGVAGGSTSRTGKVPVYWLFDSTSMLTKYYFFDGVNYSEVRMTVQNGFSMFPIVTKEMVNKYGAMSTDSLEECKAVPLPPVEPVQPTPPQEGWIDTGIENCAVGSTVGGLAGGATSRYGMVSVWYSTDENYKQTYFFKSAKTGELTEFDYDNYPEYADPDWSFGPGVINQYGTWDTNSVQACAPVRTFTDTVEVKTENCVSPLTGTITSERHFNLWNDGVKDSYGAWSVTANNCVTPLDPTPPVTVPVDPTPPVVVPVDPKPPVTTPTDPVPPVTVPDDKFTTIKDFQTSLGLCEEGATGSLKYNEYRTYDLYPDGTIKNDTGWIKSVSSNTCKTINDDIISTEDGEQNETCPEGSLGTIVVKGQWVTRGLSGRVFVESSRVENCIADIDDYVTETQTVDCPIGQSGLITKTRYRAIKTDGTSVYPFGEDYKVSENTCSAAGSGDTWGTPVVTAGKGLLRNQTVRAEDSTQIKIMTDYINASNVQADGDYKLNIIASNLSAKVIDSGKVGSLVSAWTTKTGGKVNFAGMPQTASAFIGQGPITAKNAKDMVIVSSVLNKKSGNIIVTYKETPKGTKQGSTGNFEIPLVNVSTAGKGLGYVIFGGMKLTD
jgi:hypothetical protein